MAVTILSIQNYVNQFIRDTTTNSVSANDRLRAITEACKQLMTEMGLSMIDRKYTLSYLDSVNYYNISTAVPTYLEPVAIRHPYESQHKDSEPFFRKDPDEFALEVENPEGNAYTVEYINRGVYLGITHDSLYNKVQLHNCDSLTSNGTWQVGATSVSNASDATNITLDEVEFQEGTGSINFDITVAQDASNKATISNQDISELDLSDHENISSYLARVYIPDVTNFTSITAYWGSSSSAYWSGTATTDKDGNAFVAGWNRVKINWADATKTGSADASAIDYLRLDFNYGAGQGDDTDFRVDDICMIRPENLEFHYQSWAVGETSTSNSTLVTEFTATTNVPFFSGLYDFLDVYVAHKAAAILFREMSMTNDAILEDNEAEKEKKKIGKRFPTSTNKTTKNFKVLGINHKIRR